jgi:hypothetical protein
MVLYIEKPNGNRRFYRLNTTKDFLPIFEEYDGTRYVAMSAHGLSDAAHKIAEFLSRGHLTAWVENSELNKGVKDLAIGLGLSAATALGGAGGHVVHQPAMASIVRRADDFGSKSIDNFLRTIMHLESSGGRNLAHQEFRPGEAAIGRWGMKNGTIQEMLSRHKKHLPGHLKPLIGRERQYVADFFHKKPQAELDIARYLAHHVLNRQKGNHEKAAYAWRRGHNLYPHNITPAALNQSGYVNKFRQFHVKDLSERQVPGLTKAETKAHFKERFQKWIGLRFDERREPPSRDHTFTPDPGRLRDDQEISERNQDTRSIIYEILESWKRR